jgi:hypothetical protein
LPHAPPDSHCTQRSESRDPTRKNLLQPGQRVLLHLSPTVNCHVGASAAAGDWPASCCVAGGGVAPGAAWGREGGLCGGLLCGLDSDSGDLGGGKSSADPNCGILAQRPEAHHLGLSPSAIPEPRCANNSAWAKGISRGGACSTRMARDRRAFRNNPCTHCSRVG